MAEKFHFNHEMGSLRVYFLKTLVFFLKCFFNYDFKLVFIMRYIIYTQTIEHGVIHFFNVSKKSIIAVDKSVILP